MSEGPIGTVDGSLVEAMRAAGLHLAKRESGVIVPDHLAAAPDEGASRHHTPVARDAEDGRRRLVLSDSDRRNLNRVLVLLARNGLGVIVGCVQDMAHGDGGKSCGGILLPVGKDTDDPGFACRCTRIHWAKP